MNMIPFLKMNGLGNDFLVVDARAAPVRPRREVIRALADRASRRRLRPAHHHRARRRRRRRLHAHRQCRRRRGRGLRQRHALRRLAADGRERPRRAPRSRRSAGLLQRASRRAGDAARPRSSVDMGVPHSAGATSRSPRSSATRAPSSCRSGRSTRRSCIRPRSPTSATRTRSSGSTTSTRYDLARFGPLLENHPIFPERANISLAHVTAPRRDHAAHLGARRRPDPGLRHRRLRRAGRRRAHAGAPAATRR